MILSFSKYVFTESPNFNNFNIEVNKIINIYIYIYYIASFCYFKLNSVSGRLKCVDNN